MIWWTGLAPWEFEFPFRQTEQVITGVVDAWEKMLESRFGCADFDVAAAVLQSDTSRLLGPDTGQPSTLNPNP